MTAQLLAACPATVPTVAEECPEAPDLTFAPFVRSPVTPTSWPMVKITESFVNALRMLSLPAEGTRLALGLAHAIERASEHVEGGLENMCGVALRHRLVDLRATIGPSGSNDSRAIRRGVAALEGTWMVDQVGFIHRSRVLHVQLSDLTLELLADRGKYGLADMRAVRELVQNPLAADLYLEVTLRRKRTHPRFGFMVERLAELMGHDRPAWHRVSRSFLTSLTAILARERMAALVRLEAWGRLDGVDTIVVDLFHADTEWTAKALKRRQGPTTEVLILSPSITERLDLKELTPTRLRKLLALQTGNGAAPEAGEMDLAS